MSRHYMLLCVNCNEALILGKCPQSPPSSQRPNLVYFDNIMLRNFRDDTYHHDLEFIEVIQKFFLVHRGHELRVLPDAFDSVCTLDYELMSYDRYPDFLNEALEKPDPDKDAQNLPKDLIERFGRDDR